MNDTAYRSPWMDDELEIFRDAARRFVENEIVPMYYQERLHKLFAPFRVDRGMLLANGLQEYVMRIHGSLGAR